VSSGRLRLRSQARGAQSHPSTALPFNQSPLKADGKRGGSQPTLMCCSEERKSRLESFFLAPLTYSPCFFSSVLQSHLAGYFPQIPTKIFKKKGTCLHALPACPRRQHRHNPLSGFSLPSPKSSWFCLRSHSGFSLLTLLAAV